MSSEQKSEDSMYSIALSNDNFTVNMKTEQMSMSPNKDLIVVSKQKEKSRSCLEKAYMRLIHSDNQVSLPDSYIKFPKIDFYLNLDCLTDNAINSKIIEKSSISVLNKIKKVQYSEISKKTNAVHAYFSPRENEESSWNQVSQRLKSYGNPFLNELSTQMEQINSDLYSDSAVSDSDSTFDALNSNDQIQFNLDENLAVQADIDVLFEKNKNRPMILWRGVNKQLLSMHINEAFLSILHYSPEEFQMELALAGLPEIWSSFKYELWVQQIMETFKVLYSEDSMIEHPKKSKQYTKELLTQKGKSSFAEFVSYDLRIGANKIVVEEAIDEIKPLKKKLKRKGDQIIIKENQQEEIERKQNENFDLNSNEKYFINRHYFKIQDFDFNKEKVCKVRVVSTPTNPHPLRL